MSIWRLGYVEVRSLDLERDTQFWRDVVGLVETERGDGKVYFKCWDEQDHHSVILKQDTKAGIERVAFKVEGAKDLEYYQQKLHDAGVETAYVPGDIARGEALRFPIPSEHTVELYYKMDKVASSMPRRNPLTPWPKEITWNRLSPPRLDHLSLPAADPPTTITFFTELLGFRVSEQVVDDGGSTQAAWLFATANTTHNVSILKGPNSKLHHIGFRADDWTEIRRAADVLTMNDVEIEIGPTRHGITRGFTLYFRDPSGNRFEFFVDSMRPDPDDEPITWTADQLARGVFLYEKNMPETFMQCS
jgi:catechol 2,3-dioxygenase